VPRYNPLADVVLAASVLEPQMATTSNALRRSRARTGMTFIAASV
jgi:hypothetical protein